MAFNILGTHGVNIENNQATDTYGDFVYFGPYNNVWVSNVLVSGNTFARNGRQGISITAGDHITISNNSMSQVRMSDFDIEPNSASGGGTNVTIDHNSMVPRD